MRRSISDDDLCASCCHLFYDPGDLSECSKAWPCSADTNGYIIDCDSYKECEPGDNWIKEE